MESNWTSTTRAFPSEGRTVEFLLDRRECPLLGLYVSGHFRSRWAGYAPESVRLWREVQGDRPTPHHSDITSHL
jgi:hypothetical protein